MAAVKDWITVNGQHIPIMEGQSKKEAVDKALANQKRVDDEEDRKQKQISASKKEADEKNGKKNEYDRDSFDDEAKRQGIKLTSDDIDEYVGSSYGAYQLGDKISKFIDNAPDNMKVGDETLYRGLYFNNKQEMKDFIDQGIIKSRRDGLSWTIDKDVADQFSKGTSEYSVTLVNDDDAKNAISISGISDTPSSSSEVLYSSSSDFEITDVEYHGNHATVYVTEAVMSKRKYK